MGHEPEALGKNYQMCSQIFSVQLKGSSATKYLNKATDAKKHCAVTSSQSTFSFNLFSFTVTFYRYPYISIFLEVFISDVSSNVPERILT